MKDEGPFYRSPVSSRLKFLDNVSIYNFPFTFELRRPRLVAGWLIYSLDPPRKCWCISSVQRFGAFFNAPSRAEPGK